MKPLATRGANFCIPSVRFSEEEIDEMAFSKNKKGYIKCE
jgi:hypothetical protein